MYYALATLKFRHRVPRIDILYCLLRGRIKTWYILYAACAVREQLSYLVALWSKGELDMTLVEILCKKLTNLTKISFILFEMLAMEKESTYF